MCVTLILEESEVSALIPVNQCLKYVQPALRNYGEIIINDFIQKHVPYREIVVELLLLIRGTRPLLAYVVGSLSRFMYRDRPNSVILK